MEWITILALILGPILAVFVARYSERKRVELDRKLDIFKTLMRTRRNPMSAEHVGALNLIELEFAGQKKVIEYWKELFTHFGSTHQRSTLEIESETDESHIKNSKREKFELRLQDERRKILAKLLHAMAGSLNFKSEQLEIFEGGYVPQGWADTENYNLFARQFIVDLALGKRAIPVDVIDYSKANKLGAGGSSIKHTKTGLTIAY